MSDVAPNRPANKVDDTILRYCDTLSPEEISTILKGVVSAKAIAARTQILLKSRTWLTVAQEEQIILQRMRELYLEISGKYQDDKMLSLRIKALKEIGVLIEKRKSTIDTDLNSFHAAQAIQVGQVIELALSKAFETLRSAHPDLSESEVRLALKLALPEAATEIQARTADE